MFSNIKIFISLFSVQEVKIYFWGDLVLDADPTSRIIKDPDMNPDTDHTIQIVSDLDLDPD